MWSFLGSLVPSLISAGAGWLGGLRQEQREDTAIQRGVADARAAGVDPLTALGMAGASGSSASPFKDAAEGFDRGEQRRQAAEAADLSRRATESQIELNQKQGDAMLMEARSRSIATAVQGAMQGGPGARVLTAPGGLTLDASGSDPAQRWQDEYGDMVENVYGVTKLAHDGTRQILSDVGGHLRHVQENPADRRRLFLQQ